MESATIAGRVTEAQAAGERCPTSTSASPHRRALVFVRVVGPLNLDMAVAMHPAPSFAIRRERLERQWQSATLDVGEMLTYLERVVPWMGVSATVSSTCAGSRRLLQAGENPPFEGIVLSIADTVLDLSFRRGMYGRVGKNTKP